MRDAWSIVLISSIRAACIVALFVSLLFPGTFLSPANSVAGTSSPLSNSAQPAPAAQANARNREGFRPAFQAGERDIHGSQLGGTELINLVAFQEKLYAGTGYWEDPDSRSGPQIMVLDSAGGRWRQEYAFSEKLPDGVYRFGRLTALRAITFTTDANGQTLATPFSLLIAGLEAHGGLHGGVRAQGAVFARDESGHWTETTLAIRSVRALFLFRDPVTKTDQLFVGGVGPRRAGGNREGAIFVGVYDPHAPGKIRWRTEFTDFENRVMAFTACADHLYFSAKGDLFERTTNGSHPAWEKVYSDRHSLGPNNSGLRGLTTVPDPEASGHQVILAGLEGPGLMLRIDPARQHSVTTELDIPQFLAQHWGNLRTSYVIPAYNDIYPVTNPRSRATEYLIGLQAHSPRKGEGRSAWYLVRDSKARYTLRQVRPLTKSDPRAPPSKLVAVRAITLSPFPSDSDSILYFGGYDANHRPAHDSAWLYRVGLDTALHGD